MLGYMVFLVLMFGAAAENKTAESSYPDLTFVLIGPTGSGKSSLGNALLGCDPHNNPSISAVDNVCPFQVCQDDGETASCTRRTTIETGNWNGTGQPIKVGFS